MLSPNEKKRKLGLSIGLDIVIKVGLWLRLRPGKYYECRTEYCKHYIQPNVVLVSTIVIDWELCQNLSEQPAILT